MQRFRRGRPSRDEDKSPTLRSSSGRSPTLPINSSPSRQVASRETEYASAGLENFVTEPPQTQQYLTGKISTLFRRETSQTPPQHPIDRVKRAAATANDEQPSPRKKSQKRIFYSSHNDDDSDDSYESRTATASRNSNRSQILQEPRLRIDEEDDDDSTDDESTVRSTPVVRNPTASSTDTESIEQSPSRDMTADTTTVKTDTTVKTIKRYRGFSTSIKSLFLDESLVCGAIGCFGLILSNRTEYLLHLRNERRGALSPRSFRNDRKRMPSRIIATALLLTLLLMFSTFLIWGFGTGNGVAGDYINGYDYYDQGNAADDHWWDDYLVNNDDGNAADDANNAGDDANNAGDDNANNGDDANRRRRESVVAEDGEALVWHRPSGVFKIREYQENFWEPLREIIRNEWYREEEVDTTSHRRRGEETDDAYTANGESDEAAGSYSGYRKRRDIASDIRIALLIIFLIFLGLLGRRRRMRTRFHLVRARAQEDHLYYASSDEAASRRVAFDDTREDEYEGSCSHTLCGCYPVDENQNFEDEENVEVTDQGVFKRKKKPHHEDVVARSFNCLMASCCGFLCQCWFQCLSICALAQEAREARLLIPPRYQRIDFITHQPFHEYQEAVNDLRRGWLGKARRISGIMPHFSALSRLSRYILVLSVLTVGSIVATLIFNPRAAFSWQDAVVLLATFAQSFLVLFIVHGIFHKSDLSLDAVIKLFACGFLIATPTAFCFEGLLVNFALLFVYGLYDGMVAIFGESFKLWVYGHYRLVWILSELFNAYIVAAVVEELCKYYAFRAVEHPDLVFLTGLQREENDADAVDGGLVKYPFGSHQVQALVKSRSFSDSSTRSNRSKGSHRSKSGQSKKSRREALLEQTGTTEQEFDEDERDARTRRQRAMAITTGMISVAVGLACAENFVYVFVLGGAVGETASDENHKGDVMEAWIVLFFRSIFPVHALAAAMQSINMIRKFVEADHHRGHRVGVGRIILPAVILHGTFDAILMGINVYVETAWDKYLTENNGNVGDEEPYNPIVVNLIAWISITLIMFAGIIWYFRQNRNQRARLILLEEQDKARTENWGGVSPTSDTGEMA